MILAPAIMQAESDPKVAAAKCLESVELDPESYRIGHTKVHRYPLKQNPCDIVSGCTLFAVELRFLAPYPTVSKHAAATGANFTRDLHQLI
jgi:hypothetical protein